MRSLERVRVRAIRAAISDNGVRIFAHMLNVCSACATFSKAFPDSRPPDQLKIYGVIFTYLFAVLCMRVS